MSGKLKCFHEELRGRQYNTLPVGLRVIEVSRITGSLGKCEELDGRFQPRGRTHRKERHRRTRMDRMFSSFDAGASLPPIDAYLYAGEYYVVDGHRRVASAITAGREFIDANLTEVVLLGDRRSQEGALSRRAFEQQTGLTNVRLTNEAGYRFLLKEIEATAGEGSVREKAKTWYSRTYLPACKAIERAGLPEFFPGMREGDLFVMILRFHRELDSGFEKSGDFEEVLSRFLAARRKLRFRLNRCAPFRWIARVFGRRPPEYRSPPE
ncbi:MAG: ParB N-terminal domain-containing protein [Spirochaetales bacterium]|nr:ParB N-terminal domain-containing protein [Spirochaetales bacterium]